MLPRPPSSMAIEVIPYEYRLGSEGGPSGSLHATLLRGPKFYTRTSPPRQAVFIHPEGLGVNHTLIERPARWLIAKDLFDAVILPDRRGSGRSSVLVRAFTPREQAEDLRRLLDRMAEAGRFDPPAPLVVIGLSMGGLVALSLAGIDSRVRCVALLAASPQPLHPGPLMRLLLRTGLFGKLLDRQLQRSLGRRPRSEVDFDPAYDAASPRQMSTVFDEAIQYLPPERAGSLRFDYLSALDPATACLPKTLTLDLPILQVTGEGDELWETSPSPETLRRFPRLVRRTVTGAWMHKDVFLQAEAFVNALAGLLAEHCPGLAEEG